MLKNTFIHIPGIKREIEQELWRKNIFTWQEFIDNNNVRLLNHERIKRYVERSINEFQNNSFSFFSKNLPASEHWRAYKDLKGKTCFLDIETTGLSRYYHDITLIGLYDGNDSKFFVNGKNFSEFSEEIKKYDNIVTFNGRWFDVPFILEKFPEIDICSFHIDLRIVMKMLGYTGGLKRIERMLNINRDDEIKNVDGYEAVRLWYKYKKGDNDALSKLIEYNKADIVNLKILMDFAYPKLKEKVFFNFVK